MLLLVFTAQSRSAPSRLTSIATTPRSRSRNGAPFSSWTFFFKRTNASAHANRRASFSFVPSRSIFETSGGRTARLSRAPRRTPNSAQRAASYRGRRQSASSSSSSSEKSKSSSVSFVVRLFVVLLSRGARFSGTTRATLLAATLTMALSSSPGAFVVRTRLRIHLCASTSALNAASRTPSTRRATGPSQGLASAGADANHTTCFVPPNSVGTSATRNATSCGRGAPRPSPVSSSRAAASLRSARVGSYGRISALRSLRDMAKWGDGRGGGASASSPRGAPRENARGELVRWRAARAGGWRRAGSASAGDTTRPSASAPPPRRMPRKARQGVTRDVGRGNNDKKKLFGRKTASSSKTV